MEAIDLKEKIYNFIDRIIPPKVVIRLKKDDLYGYKYKRHYHGEGAYGGMSMLCYGIACEMQRICKTKEEMKEVSRDMEKSVLRLACDMSDNDYIIIRKPEMEEDE